jgi:dihydrofolate reductase
MTRQPDYSPDGATPSAPVYTVASSEEAVELAASFDTDEVFVAGGAQIYRLFLDMADRIYLTRIQHRFEGDVFFPDLDSSWHESIREPHGVDGPFPFIFSILERTR